MRAEQHVECIEHIADAQVLDVLDRARKVPPKIPQQVAPGYLAVGNAVELLLERGGEIVLDVTGKEALQECYDQSPLVLGNQPLFLEPHVAAVLEHRKDRRIGRWSSDAELLHPFDE